MSSTFNQETDKVPPELIRQGWRREPSQEVIIAWNGADELSDGHWQGLWIQPAPFRMLRLWRPIISIGQGKDAGVYAHQGWGGGLAPTPEMVEVWKWWWALEDDEMIPVSVVLNKGELFARNWQDIKGDYCTIRCFDFRGPVLPPAGMP